MTVKAKRLNRAKRINDIGGESQRDDARFLIATACRDVFSVFDTAVDAGRIRRMRIRQRRQPTVFRIDSQLIAQEGDEIFIELIEQCVEVRTVIQRTE